MLEKNKSFNSRPVLSFEKEIISKADINTIENMSGTQRSGKGLDSSIPTIPTTWANVAIAEA